LPRSAVTLPGAGGRCHVSVIAGWMLAKYANAKPWQGGVALALTGSVLIVAIIALGG